MTTVPGVVVFRRTGGVDDIDSIDAYSRWLVDVLAAEGVEACYEAGGLAPVLRMAPAPRWVLLQYNPFRFGRAGFAPSVVRDVARLRRRSHAPLAVMVHEAWIEMTDAKSSLIGAWQRAQLRTLLRYADAVLTSTEALAREIGRGAVHVPVPANITPVPTSHVAARERLGLDGRLAVALFGQDHPSRALDHAEAAIAALAEVHGHDRLAILNLGAGAPPLGIPRGVDVSSPGRLSNDELSLRLWASDIVLLPFTDGVSTRRSTLMAALAHGRPVLGSRGHNTDALLAQATDAMVLTRADDRAAFTRAAVKLTSDPVRLRAVGDAGRRLYESRFDWPVTARQVRGVLQTITTTRRRVVFVANEVGGSGGMERHTEQLVRRLLDAGRPVTVIARSCTIRDSENLRFVRVPTPRRPAVFGYPAFFAVASILVTRNRTGLLHTTGAIVANRADVSTIHFCHRAAAARIDGSRASRSSLLYRMNARVSRIFSLAGEAWCYRPGRIRVLCAVSSGVAAELREYFPAMARAVRTIPNGVDSAVFRPDPEARRAVRAELGVNPQAELVLFAGGDWERKGLPHAVDALALAPDWHLAVAGTGDLEA
jgi:glycosyltransferase involved in cell wall biosynthesis